jgi:hypothetical protein
MRLQVNRAGLVVVHRDDREDAVELGVRDLDLDTVGAGLEEPELGLRARRSRGRDEQCHDPERRETAHLRSAHRAPPPQLGTPWTSAKARDINTLQVVPW